MLKKIAIVLFLILSCLTGFAQKPAIDVGAPALVAEGEQFKVEFASNTKPDGFEPPDFEGFDVLAGPTVSQRQSISISGNDVVKEQVYSYIYVLQATKAGNYKIGEAKMSAGKKSWSSTPTPIEVVTAESRPKQGQQTLALAKDDILLRTIVDKTNVYKGEPVRVTFKLYTRVSISSLRNGKYPAFNGFWTQELPTNHYRVKAETYNSKIYDTKVLAEYLIYPQQSGVLQVEAFNLTATAQIMVESDRRRSPIEEFFGGGPEVKEVSRNISAPAVQIVVNDLPAGAPEGFSGAVGDFKMTAETPNIKVGANTSEKYVIKISGTGNLPLIQAPKLELPSSFELYNIKTTENLEKNVNGISGYRQFEYPFIARSEGDFKINPAVFAYFNPTTRKYVSLKTNSFELSVTPDSTSRNTPGAIVSGVSQEDLRILAQDIRFIKIGSHGLKERVRPFVGSWAYFGTLATVAALFALLFVLTKKRMETMQNSTLMRGKRANKVALTRLRAAEAFMKSDNKRGFYEEMLKALWGYMSDKFNIPVSNLTKENIREELIKRSVAIDQANKYIDIITQCEYAQYSPSEAQQVQEVYRCAVESISKFEAIIKKKQ